VQETYDTYEPVSTNGANWRKPAALLAGGGGTALLLINRRRRKKATAAERARETARELPGKAREAALEIPGKARDAARELPERAEEVGDAVGRALGALMDGLKKGQWQAWAALLGGVWLLFRLGEVRELKRIRRVVDTGGAA
jgi:hypothetical protein